jgi:16S rRNA (cytidine1402-2'-O)-methyltransferase
MTAIKSKGTIYLIPTPLIPESTIGISQESIDTINTLDHFFAERAKTARHFLKKVHLKEIQSLHVFEMDKRDNTVGVSEIIELLNNGVSIGVLSEAGCPAVADPGNFLVQEAHHADIPIKPIIGPSSILLALMASGLNGQNFHFLGYLPNKTGSLAKALRKIDQRVQNEGVSCIFIETPYRNMALVETMLKELRNTTKLCIASNLTDEHEWVKTKSIADWKNRSIPDLHKIPCIFIVGK